jgi:hypothetical protein
VRSLRLQDYGEVLAQGEGVAPAMISDPNYICPLCGLVLPSLADYHAHFFKTHDDARVIWKPRPADTDGVGERRGSYSNGCPILAGEEADQ